MDIKKYNLFVLIIWVSSIIQLLPLPTEQVHQFVGSHIEYKDVLVENYKESESSDLNISEELDRRLESGINQIWVLWIAKLLFTITGLLVAFLALKKISVYFYCAGGLSIFFMGVWVWSYLQYGFYFDFPFAEAWDSLYKYFSNSNKLLYMLYFLHGEVFLPVAHFVIIVFVVYYFVKSKKDYHG